MYCLCYVQKKLCKCKCKCAESVCLVSSLVHKWAVEPPSLIYSKLQHIQEKRNFIFIATNFCGQPSDKHTILERTAELHYNYGIVMVAEKRGLVFRKLSRLNVKTVILLLYESFTFSILFFLEARILRQCTCRGALTVVSLQWLAQ